MSKVVIFGTGSFAEVVHFYLTNDSSHEVVAFTAHADRITAATLCGLPVVPFETLGETHGPEEYAMFVAVGYNRLNRTRQEIYDEVKRRGYSCVTFVSQQCTNRAKAIGDNCFIFEDNTLQPFATIGNNVVLWSGNHIGHHATIGDHCFVTSHVVISGHVRVGTHCFIGVNSTFRDNISIGDYCLVGAGALIMKSAPDKALFVPRRTEQDPRSTDSIQM